MYVDMTPSDLWLLRYALRARLSFDQTVSGESTIVPLADLFRLLGDPTRLRIVLACVDERRAVGAIAEGLGLSPSLVSHHLRLLRAARIVRAERQGKQVFYLRRRPPYQRDAGRHARACGRAGRRISLDAS